MPEQVRWGIIGAADIARKVCVAMTLADGATCVAVASRTLDKATQFVKDNELTDAKAYGSYEELLNDENVQVVYMPIPTAVRAEWVIKAAEKGKHILCEKPLATSVKELDQIMDAVKKAGVQFMDDTMMMHGERTESFLKALKDREKYGTPRHVESSFTLPCALMDDWAATNVRMKASAEPQGCMGDLGWYCIRVCLLAFNFEEPIEVRCDILDRTDGVVPVHATAVMKFSGGRSAAFTCSFKLAWQQWFDIVGDKQVLRVEDFVVPFSLEKRSYQIFEGSCGDKALTFPRETVSTKEFTGTAEHTSLIEKFSSIVSSGKLEMDWPEWSKKTQTTLLACMESGLNDGKWVKLEDFKSKRS